MLWVEGGSEWMEGRGRIGRECAREREWEDWGERWESEWERVKGRMGEGEERERESGWE